MRARLSDAAGLIGILLGGILLLLVLAQWLELFTLLQVTLYAVMGILALSLAFVTGYGGILCLGQSAFFGLGAYVYAISVINMGDSTLPFLLSIIAPALLAAALGYFIFYGRINEVYVGVVTLTVALILYNVVNSTAGPEYHVGTALIGGFNGIPSIPTLNMPFMPDASLDPVQTFYLCGGLLLASYLGLRLVLRSRFGQVVVAIRENEQRAELLGYDIRLHKLLAFALGGGLAGLAGCLFANWGSFISPSAFGVVQSAQVIIWVMVGGTGTLLGPILGATLLTWLTAVLGMQQTINANLVFGAVLLVFVLLVPRGILPLLQAACTRPVQWVLARRYAARIGVAQPGGAE